MIILGISVGTSNTGIGILRDDNLIERSIHSYHVPPWSDSKMRIILNRYREHIIKRNVTDIVVKTPLIYGKNKAITTLIKRIEQLAKEHDCTFITTSKRNIRQSLDMHRREEFADYAVLLYPELSHLHSKGERNGHRYYNKVYEAVLSAHIYKEKLRKERLERKTATN
jgi:hypothetical protein